MQPVALCVDNHVARIEFGDPAQRNLLDEPLLEALLDALRRAENAARVVVLAGRGALWSAGYDVSRIPAALFAADAATVAAHPFERCMRACGLR
jgi:enoyl-CoA hydratase/carnithine racemase